MRYLDPKNDFTFKKVFGQHPELTKSFLNALLPLQTPIVELEYLPAELVPEIPEMKDTLVNVRCIDQNQRQFIVEMQMYWTTSFKSRMLFNASKAYVRQANKGDTYEALCPVYALSIVNEIFEYKIPNYFHHYKFVHLEHTDKVLDGLELFFIELPKFKPIDIAHKQLGDLWLQYLELRDQTDKIAPELMDIKEIRHAVDLLEESSYSKPELEFYDKYWDSISRQKTLLSGIRKEGIEEGEIKAMSKFVAKMKADLVPSDVIAKYTGLTIDEIEKL